MNFLAKLPPEVLQALQWTALVLLPATTTLWLALGPIWGLPRVQEVGATLTAIDAFLGTILGVSAQALAREQAAVAAGHSEDLQAELEALREELTKLKKNTGDDEQ